MTAAGTPTTKRLDHLPIVAHALQRLGLRQIVDELVPVDPRSYVTTGECVEALVTSILMGTHTLYRVADTLEPFDLQLAFGFGERASPEHLNDERLAKALDDLFSAGVAPVNAAALLAAVRAFELELRCIHSDTTSISVYGDYTLSEEPADPEDPNAIPHVTRGFSKDHRPDLKQVLYGLCSSGDGGVPIFGRTASGNRADPLEARFLMRQMAELLPDPRATVLVGDSKLFTGETLLLVEKHGLSYVSLISRSFGLWEEAYAAFEADRANAPVLKLKESSGGELHGWRGRSYDLTHFHEDEQGDVHAFPVRAVVVESDALKARKGPSLERRRLKERLGLEKLKAKEEARVYACEADARAAAARIESREPTFHTTTTRVRTEEQKEKRPRRGRPRQGEECPTRTVWRVDLDYREDPDKVEAVLAKETCFVLATNVPRDGERGRSDQELLLEYDEQHTVESCFRWLKGPLSVAPIFLKTPERIGALGLVYVLALMVYALIQRDVRRRLAEENTTMPGNKGWTNKPTTEVLFRLFEGIFTIRTGQPGAPVVVTNLNTEQVRIFELLGIAAVLSQSGVALAPPREPRPGERAFKPRPRRPRRQPARNSGSG